MLLGFKLLVVKVPPGDNSGNGIPLLKMIDSSYEWTLGMFGGLWILHLMGYGDYLDRFQCNGLSFFLGILKKILLHQSFGTVTT